MICGDLWRNGKARNPVCDKSSGNSICKHVWQWNSFRPTCETIYLVNKYEYPLHVGSGPTRSIWTWSKRMSGGRKEAGGETVCWWIFDHWQCKQARVHAGTSELMLGQTYRAVIGSELPEFQGGKEHEGCWICYGWKWEEWTGYSSWNVTDDGNIGERIGIDSSFKEESTAWYFASVGSLFWASAIYLKSILGIWRREVFMSIHERASTTLLWEPLI